MSSIYRSMTLELAYNLEGVGYAPCYAILALSAAACDSIRAESPLVKPYCFLDSVLVHHSRGYTSRGSSDLWVTRYHAASLFAAAGVGVTLLDCDSVVSHPFLGVLDQLSEDYSLIILPEGPANGGTWHLRASPDSGAALWVIRQIERLNTMIAKFQVTGGGGNAELSRMQDQEVLGLGLRVACTLGGSAYDWWEEYERSSNKSHGFWQRFPQTRPSQQACDFSDLPLPIKVPWGQGAGDSEAFVLFRKWLVGTAAREVVIRTPSDDAAFDEDAPPEKVLAAPPTLWAFGGVLEFGWPRETGVSHLLGIAKSWTTMQYGFQHSGRLAQWVLRPGMRTMTLHDFGGRPFMRLAQHMVDMVKGFTSMRYCWRHF